MNALVHEGKTSDRNWREAIRGSETVCLVMYINQATFAVVLVVNLFTALVDAQSIGMWTDRVDWTSTHPVYPARLCNAFCFKYLKLPAEVWVFLRIVGTEKVAGCLYFTFACPYLTVLSRKVPKQASPVPFHDLLFLTCIVWDGSTHNR